MAQRTFENYTPVQRLVAAARVELTDLAYDQTEAGCLLARWANGKLCGINNASPNDRYINICSSTDTEADADLGHWIVRDNGKFYVLTDEEFNSCWSRV